jgi:hypothetical protein
MTAILITPEKIAEITAVVARARASVIPWDKLKDIAVENLKSTLKLSDRRDPHWRPTSESVEFEGGVQACISFEEQPAGIFRHLSISTRDGRAVLSQPMFLEVARLFGIELPSSKAGAVWVEEYAPGRYAINVVMLEAEREGPETIQ